MLDVLYSKSSDTGAQVDDFLSDELDISPFLETIVQDPVLKEKDLKVAIKNVQKTVKIFKKLLKLMDKLREVTNKTPILDVKTRWNSLCTMIKRFLEIKTHLNTILVRNSLDVLLSSAEIETLQNLVEIFHPVEIAVTSLSAMDVNLCTADLIMSRMIAIEPFFPT